MTAQLRTAIYGFALLTFPFLCLGCYTFSGTTLPGHLRTVRIQPIENRTLQSALADKLTTAITEGFQRGSNLRRVNENADAEFYGVLTEYSHKPQSISGETVTSFRIDMLMSIAFVDRVKGDTLYKEDRVPGFGYYSAERGENEETGQKAAIESMVKVIMDNTVSGW